MCSYRRAETSAITLFDILQYKEDESVNEPQVTTVIFEVSLYSDFIPLGMTSGVPQAFDE